MTISRKFSENNLLFGRNKQSPALIVTLDQGIFTKSGCFFKSTAVIFTSENLRNQKKIKLITLERSKLDCFKTTVIKKKSLKKGKTILLHPLIRHRCIIIYDNFACPKDGMKNTQ